MQGLCSVYLNILFSLMNYTKTNLLFLKREHLGHIFCIPKATCVERGSTVPRHYGNKCTLPLITTWVKVTEHQDICKLIPFKVAHPSIA